MPRRLVLIVLLLLLASAEPVPADQVPEPGTGGVQAPLAAEELSRFMDAAPRFLRWARAQGLDFHVYPDPALLTARDMAWRTSLAVRELGWDSKRFMFLLCATGAAAEARQQNCGRPLQASEVSLLRESMFQLMDLYGTGP